MQRTDKKFLGLQKWDDFKPDEEQAFGNNYAYNPIVARNKAGGFLYQFTELIQEPTKQDPNIVYAVPPHYTKDFTTRLWEFDEKFPQFTLPNNKLVVMDVRKERPNGNTSNEGMLTRGVSLAKNSSKSVGFVSDAFLEAIECPSREFTFNNGIAAFDDWINTVTQTALNNAIFDAIAPYANYELVMLNWECIAQTPSGNNQNIKLLNMLEYAKNTYPNVKLSCWNVKAAGVGRDAYQSEVTLETSANFVATAQIVDYQYVGGYINFPTDYGVIHHYLKEYYDSLALVPNKQALATIWFDFEFLAGYFDPRNCSPKGKDNNPLGDPTTGNYIWGNKPAVFNQVMYNWGVWTVAVGDGFHLWSDPDDWADNVAYYPFEATINGNPLTKVGGKMYARNDMKNIDWLMRGVYGVSKHKAIIDDTTTQWVFVNTINNSLYLKLPLIAYKKSGNEILFLAYSWYNYENNTESVTVNVDEVNYTLQMNGTWTTIKKF